MQREGTKGMDDVPSDSCPGGFVLRGCGILVYHGRGEERSFWANHAVNREKADSNARVSFCQAVGRNPAATCLMRARAASCAPADWLTTNTLAESPPKDWHMSKTQAMPALTSASMSAAVPFC